ncbi:hypothetical protein A986_02241 [Pseudomonas fluorescens BRIP34879]|nr:hypothetical protein A986_02241 [Pseudomonas fluorescens BRIP34879]
MNVRLPDDAEVFPSYTDEEICSFRRNQTKQYETEHQNFNQKLNSIANEVFLLLDIQANTEAKLALVDMLKSLQFRFERDISIIRLGGYFKGLEVVAKLKSTEIAMLWIQVQHLYQMGLTLAAPRKNR